MYNMYVYKTEYVLRKKNGYHLVSATQAPGPSVKWSHCPSHNNYTREIALPCRIKRKLKLNCVTRCSWWSRVKIPFPYSWVLLKAQCFVLSPQSWHLRQVTSLWCRELRGSFSSGSYQTHFPDSATGCLCKHTKTRCSELSDCSHRALQLRTTSPKADSRTGEGMGGQRAPCWNSRSHQARGEGVWRALKIRRGGKKNKRGWIRHNSTVKALILPSRSSFNNKGFLTFAGQSNLGFGCKVSWKRKVRSRVYIQDFRRGRYI